MTNPIINFDHDSTSFKKMKISNYFFVNKHISDTNRVPN